MSINSLFIIILKVIGIFLLKDFFLSFFQFLASLFLVFSSGDYISLITFSVNTLILGVVIFYLLFKTALILNKLKLDQGFESDLVGFNVNRATVLSIALIITASLLLLNEIPILFKQVYTYVSQKQMLKYSGDIPDVSYILLSTSKILLGIILLVYQKIIVSFIVLKSKFIEPKTELVNH